MEDLGVIFHIGIYSIYAFDSVKSAKRRTVQNGSEWYKERLEVKDDSYRPVAGHKETKKYHTENYGDSSYFDVIEEFDVSEKAVSKWMKISKKIGAKYVILTTKHHDGFCLWDTGTTNLKCNLVDMFIKNAKKYNLDFGFYYSWLEFGQKFNVKFFNEVCVKQITELSKYNPKYIWWDGDWLISQKVILNKIDELIPMLFPNCIINDRIGKRKEIPEYVSYRVFSDRFIPSEKLDISWQHINTIGYSWGLNLQQKEEDYKTGEEIFELYEKIKNLGGNFLINIGPDKNGKIDKNEKKSLKSFGKLLKK